MKIFKIVLVVTCLFINYASFSKAEPLELMSNVDMFDIGLAKINNDQNYDIYTVNHQFAESYLISDNGKFSEHGLSLGLKQTVSMPDYEPTGRSPVLKKGLNIYSVARRQLLLFCHKCDKEIKGTIKFPTPVGDKSSISLIHKEFASIKQPNITEIGKPFISINFQLEKNMSIKNLIKLGENLFKVRH